MPAKSRSQQKLMGAVHICQKTGKCISPEVKKIAGEMKEKDVKDFAKTKHKGLPEKVKKKKKKKGMFSEWLAKKNLNESCELKNYMFFSNLRVIKDRIEEILAMDPYMVDSMLEDGHDWAREHLATAKDDVEEVHNWLTSR
jgi:hypothetical protein